jgi:extradiol dioxygenase family protein
MSGAVCFHLAFPVASLSAARAFYGGVLGCREGRSADDWVDFDFFGHQISTHLMPEATGPSAAHDVDGDDVPVRHFGVVLEWDAWHDLAASLRRSGILFLIEPHVRFAGQVGEQATLFIADPSGNAIEFKAFKDPRAVFATEGSSS